jgi:hypothetical protein
MIKYACINIILTFIYNTSGCSVMLVNFIEVKQKLRQVLRCDNP